MTGFSDTDINLQQKQWCMHGEIAHLPAYLTPQWWITVLAPSQRPWSSSTPFFHLIPAMPETEWSHTGGIKPAWCYTMSAVLQRSWPREFDPILREFNGLIIGKVVFPHI